MAVLYAIISSITATLVAVIAALNGVSWLGIMALYTITAFVLFALLLAFGMLFSPQPDWDHEVGTEIDSLKDHMESQLGTLVSQIFR